MKQRIESSFGLDDLLDAISDRSGIRYIDMDGFQLLRRSVLLQLLQLLY